MPVSRLMSSNRRFISSVWLGPSGLGLSYTAYLQLRTFQPGQVITHDEDDLPERGSEEHLTDQEHQWRASDVFDDRSAAVRHVPPARNQSHRATSLLRHSASDIHLGPRRFVLITAVRSSYGVTGCYALQGQQDLNELWLNPLSKHAVLNNRLHQGVFFPRKLGVRPTPRVPWHSPQPGLPHAEKAVSLCAAT